MENGSIKTITIDDVDIEVIKSAFSYYIRDIEFQIKKIENLDFDNFEKLSDCQHRILNLKQDIADAEKFLDSEEPVNPRQLRDELPSREEKLAKTKTDLLLMKKELEKAESDSNEISNSLNYNAAEIENLKRKIEAAEKILQKKLNGNEISQKGN